MNGTEILRKLKVDGWCVLPDVVPQEEVAALRGEVVEQELLQRAEFEATGQERPTVGIGHAQGLVNYIPRLAGYLADPRIVAAAEAIFGPYIKVSSVGGLVNFPGNKRGYWHSDWPFNQLLATRMAVPYPDVAMHLSGVLMLTDFSPENGATLIVPGSHRAPDNPTADNGVDRYAPYPTEMHVCGPAGSMLFYDSRLWHSAAANSTPSPRVAVTVRYGPWWINLEPRRPGSLEFRQVMSRSSGRDNSIPLMSREAFEMLPEHAKPLFMHWIDERPQVPPA